jgi:hypothetical protein
MSSLENPNRWRFDTSGSVSVSWHTVRICFLFVTRIYSRSKNPNFLYSDNFSTILIGYCTLWIRFVFETQNAPWWILFDTNFLHPVARMRIFDDLILLSITGWSVYCSGSFGLFYAGYDRRHSAGIDSVSGVQYVVFRLFVQVTTFLMRWTRLVWLFRLLRCCTEEKNSLKVHTMVRLLLSLHSLCRILDCTFNTIFVFA